jgi:hypothetical protein
LVLPADSSWTESATGPCPPHPRQAPPSVATATLEGVAKALRSGERSALLLGGSALRSRGLHAASRVSNASGAPLLGETFPANLERGAGVPAVDRLGYLAEFAQAQMAGVGHLILVDASSPVSFFAYPDKPSDLVPPGCTIHTLVRPGENAPEALEALADLLGASPDGATPAPATRPGPPAGSLTTETLAAAIGATLPENAIVVDEGVTAGLFVSGATAGAPRHDWLTLTGGAIGIGPPAATGAAVAAPERPVLCVQADGSAMYTLQALWTQAREGLNVTTGSARTREAHAPDDCSTSPTRSSTSSRSLRGWAWRAAGWRRPKHSLRRSRRASPSPGHRSLRFRCPEIGRRSSVRRSSVRRSSVRRSSAPRPCRPSRGRGRKVSDPCGHRGPRERPWPAGPDPR